MKKWMRDGLKLLLILVVGFSVGFVMAILVDSDTIGEFDFNFLIENSLIFLAILIGLLYVPSVVFIEVAKKTDSPNE